MLQHFTRKVDWAASPLVRRYGVTGARRFYIVWGILTYILLVATAAPGFVALSRLDERTGTRLLLYLAVFLFVVAASLLARMLKRIFAELREVETRQK